MIEYERSSRAAARRLRIIVQWIGLIVVALIAFAAFTLLSGQQGGSNIIKVENHGLPPWMAAILLAGLAFFVGLAMVHLVRLLEQVEAGSPFAIAANLRGFARYLFLAVLTSVLAPPLLQAAMGLAGGGGYSVRFSLGLGEGLALLVTGLLYFVARLIDAAQALADDHSQIV
jgi:hypothetical protein